MKKLFILMFFTTLTITSTTSSFAQCGKQPCPAQEQQLKVPFQAISLPFDQNGKIKSGVYQGSVYLLRTPEYNKAISVIFFIAGNNTPFEINGIFTRKTPSDWNGYFVKSEVRNLTNKVYESGLYDNITGEPVVVSGDYVTPKRLPALLHFDETGSWAEILLK